MTNRLSGPEPYNISLVRLWSGQDVVLLTVVVRKLCLSLWSLYIQVLPIIRMCLKDLIYPNLGCKPPSLILRREEAVG